MKVLKQSFQIGFFLILSVFFVHCTKDLDIDDYGNDDLILSAPNTYDVTFTKAGSETIRFKGSIKDDDAAPSTLMEGFDQKIPDVKLLSFSIYDNNKILAGSIVLDKNNKPYPLLKEADAKGYKGSTLIMTDGPNNRNMVSSSGSLTMSKLKIHTTVSTGNSKVHIVSYVLEFKGDFVVTPSGGGAAQIYSATGKIVMSPFN